MKMTASWIQKTVVCAMTFAFALSVVADTKEIKAKVTRIKGSARYSADATNWKPLKVGQSLGAGMVVQTAANSYVDLVLGADEVVKMAPRIAETFSVRPPPESAFEPVVSPDSVRVFADSVLAIDKLTSTKTGMDDIRETQLDLRAGSVFGKVKKMSAASKYEIKLPNGVAGIRGTVYMVSDKGVVSVLVGSVVVSIVGPNGSVVTQVVNGGYQYDPSSGALTPLTDVQTGALSEAAQTLGQGVYVEPTEYTLDQTVITVSPTTGTAPQGHQPPDHPGDYDH
jgi:hypothetical protein